ncbi:MAG: dicarboxylate/amino acid:cation symporter [Treponema sp.]|nr:dicarboxylate/amino acid:cation symporter [Treponema sp.]
MKVWIKLLIGTALGVCLGILLPENQNINDALDWLEQLVIRIGRYAVIPVLVFSLTIAVYELKQDKKFWSLIIKNFFLMIGLSIVIITAGVLLAFLFTRTRIENITITEAEKLLNVEGYITDIFPANMFQALVGDGVYLLPVFMLSIFFAIGLSYDKNFCKPVIALVDSLSRIFYHIASFFIELFGFLVIVLACFWTMRFREILQAGIFSNLMIVLSIITGILILGLLPLLLLFIKPKINPWMVLFASIGPAFAAFFSGDINFSLPLLMRHAKENLGSRRRGNTVSLTLFCIFCRAGSAMVSAVSLIVILKSYSSLGITTTDVISICASALLVSFMLARHPGDGAYTALTVLCLNYEDPIIRASYLHLKPMLFFLIAIGALLDVMLAAFANYALSHTSGLMDEKKPAHFI